MRDLTAGFLMLLGLVLGPSATPHEASTSLATKDVRPFLEHLNSRLHLGLDVAAMAKFARETAVRDERTLPVSARFNGNLYSVSFHVFADDIDDSQIYFFTTSEALSAAILAEMRAYAERRGM